MTSKPRSHGEGPPHSWKAAGLWHAETTSPKAYAETDTEYSALSLEQVDILKKHSRMLSRLTLQKPVKQSHRIIDDASLAWPEEVEQYLTNVMGSVFQEISHKELRESVQILLPGKSARRRRLMRLLSQVPLHKDQKNRKQNRSFWVGIWIQGDDFWSYKRLMGVLVM